MKLKLKSKDITTNITEDASMPNLKVSKKNSKKLKFKGSKRQKKKRFDNSVSKTKDSRNTNASKMKSLVIENSEAESLFDSESEDDVHNIPINKQKISSNASRASALTPTPQKHNISTSNISRKSDASKSDVSNGSYVGSNLVFVPTLNIQQDVIEKEEKNKKKHTEEIKLTREVNKKNPRFQMKRMSGEKNMKKNLIKAKNDNIINVRF
jgi:hypothetical protein